MPKASPKPPPAPARARPARTPRARSKSRLSRKDPKELRFPVIYRRLEKEYADAKCALGFSNPHEMLFATILSAQCTDAMVNRVTADLFPKYPTIKDYANADVAEFEKDIKPTGFFRQKTKSIIRSAQIVLDEFGGEVPDTMEELVRLPGVARKTANIVLGNSFGKVEGIAVDTHVKRLSKRLGLTNQSNPDKIEKDLMKLVPKSKWFQLTYLFIEHGRKVCKAPIPRCEDCVLSEICPSSRV